MARIAHYDPANMDLVHRWVDLQISKQLLADTIGISRTNLWYWLDKPLTPDRRRRVADALATLEGGVIR